MGRGILVERVLNSNGSPAATVQQSLETKRLDWPRIDRMLEALRRWALDYGVVISELNVKNLLHKMDGNAERLVVIDGIGGRKPDVVFFLRQHIAWMARYKTRKRWQREYNKVRKAAVMMTASRH